VSMTFDKVKITSVKTDVDYYCSKKKKRLQYKTPKVYKRVLFEDTIWELGELYREMKNCHERKDYGSKLIVSLEVSIDY